jgi:hypothetical protein
MDEEHDRGDDGHRGHEGGAGRGYVVHGGPAELGGLTVAADGLRVVPGETRVEAGGEHRLTFRVFDEDEVVTDFREVHDARAHLILVRRDLTRFQHLHPELDDDGTWSVPVTLPDPGAYRAFVDIAVGEHPTTLGFDLLASGDAAYEPAPEPSRRATADGYEVTLATDVTEATDEIVAGEAAHLSFDVRRDGESVSELEPYLGALGHLVALRDGDLAYLHVHPLDGVDEGDNEGDDGNSTEGSGNAAEGSVTFRATFPTPGGYGLFLQAKPEGELVTAQFAVDVSRE